jgi:hypothetical protein
VIDNTARLSGQTADLRPVLSSAHELRDEAFAQRGVDSGAMPALLDRAHGLHEACEPREVGSSVDAKRHLTAALP